jgi:hypothetical protein
MDKPFALELWLQRRDSNTDPDEYEDASDLDQLRRRVEDHRSEGRYVRAVLWQRRADRPDAWVRIESFDLTNRA